MSRRDETVIDTEETEEQSQELAILPPAVVDQFVTVLNVIPEAPPEEAMERIVTQIFQAEEAHELDQPWNAHGMRDLVGRVIRVQDVKRLPSEFTAGLGVYMGCQCVLESTGEYVFVTTGSVSIMAQLAQAYRKEMLPLDVVPRVSEKPSRNGFFPMHLEIVRTRS